MRLGTASPDRLDAKWLKILDDSANSGVGTYARSSSSAHWYAAIVDEPALREEGGVEMLHVSYRDRRVVRFLRARN